jgi:hypothetical protein
MDDRDDHEGRLRNLRAWNVGVGLVHLAQGVVLLLISTSFAIPLVGSVPSGPPGTPITEQVTFFELNVPWAIAVFLFLAAADHLLTAGPVRGWYERNLLRGVNVARWVEYSISASIMIVLIAVLTGIDSLYALIALFGVNASMILFGLLMELFNRAGERVSWWPFVFGCIAGVVPWIAITLSLVTAQVEAPSGEGVPGFVFGIFVSLFVLFNCFALNQWLQYRGVGRFADYLFGEKVYLVLSLGAKSALAWQIYAGTLGG